MMLKFPIADRWDVVCSVNFLFGFVCIVCAQLQTIKEPKCFFFIFFYFFYFIYFFIVTVSVIKRYNDHPHPLPLLVLAEYD